MNSPRPSNTVSSVCLPVRQVYALLIMYLFQRSEVKCDKQNRQEIKGTDGSL